MEGTLHRGQIGIVGGSGFIGTRLAECLLRQRFPIRIIDKAPSSIHGNLWVPADVRDADALLEACQGCEVLYNLAAEHRDDVQPEDLYDQVNVLGAHNTCHVAERLGIERLIFTSTAAVYGLPEGEADESTIPKPFNSYGRTKLEAEGAFRAWAERSSQRSLTIVRPTVVFGPGNRGNVYLLLKQIAEGRSVVIGDGRNKKSMAYIANVADFLVHVLSLGPSVHLYNYVDKPDTDMNTLVSLAAQETRGARAWRIPFALGLVAGAACDLTTRLTGLDLPISVVRVRKYAANTQFAADRIAQTGFRPRHSLHDALLATIRHEFADSPSSLSSRPAASSLS